MAPLRIMLSTAGRDKLHRVLAAAAARTERVVPCPQCSSELTRPRPHAATAGARVCDSCGTTWNERAR